MFQRNTTILNPKQREKVKDLYLSGHGATFIKKILGLKSCTPIYTTLRLARVKIRDQSESEKSFFSQNEVWNKGLTKGVDERVRRYSETLSRRFYEGRYEIPHITSRGKNGFRKDLGHNCRSSWEANFARILKYCGIRYCYEGYKFWIKTPDGGKTIYQPDFYIVSLDLYVEVKGYLSEKSLFKVNLFKTQYPHIKFLLLDPIKYGIQKKIFQPYIKSWEKD